MLSNHNILVIGGDERYVEVIQQLKSNGVKIQVCGFEKLPQQMDVLHTTLENVDFRKLDAILLPVSGTNEQGKIELAPFSENDLLLTEQKIGRASCRERVVIEDVVVVVKGSAY